MNWINGYLPNYSSWGGFTLTHEQGPSWEWPRGSRCLLVWFWYRSAAGAHSWEPHSLEAFRGRAPACSQVTPSPEPPRVFTCRRLCRSTNGLLRARPRACRPTRWVSNNMDKRLIEWQSPKVGCFAKNFTFILHLRDLLTKETTHYTKQFQFFYRLLDLISTYSH